MSRSVTASRSCSCSPCPTCGSSPSPACRAAIGASRDSVRPGRAIARPDSTTAISRPDDTAGARAGRRKGGAVTDEENAPEPRPKSAPADRERTGPLDVQEANAVRPYVDLGGVKIPPREGLGLRLEVEEGTGRVVAVGLDFANS